MIKMKLYEANVHYVMIQQSKTLYTWHSNKKTPLNVSSLVSSCAVQEPRVSITHFLNILLRQG